ncbi:MAG TPA: Lrp/AsnC family transcriptional regulator [Methanothrix sp.]|nr:Lrp/AsnC family transcriptional regulator [Methanothrix sp.]
MIKVDAGQEKAAFASLQKRPGMRDVYPLFGEYSFFLVMQAEKKDDLGRMVAEIKASRSVIKTGPVLVTAESCRRPAAAS